MSKLVSMRLEDELASWVESYREKRGWSRAELISKALRSFRADCEGGVPDLADEAPVPEPTPAVQPVAGVTTARRVLERGVSMEAMARQRKLNEAAARARAKP